MADIVINGETFPGIASVTLNSTTDTATFLSTDYVLVGTPEVAETAADMTETDKIYVYVGSEEGYTAGNWYYFNGTSWASGGVFGSSGGGISNNARNLLKYILERVAYTETGMQIYVNALYEALKQIDSPPTETYTILNTLVNVTNSNGATSIASGSAYSAILSVESGYTWGTVTITMGETDITSSAYNSSTHEISIASVTGDIEIIASATAPVTTYLITNALTHVTNSNSSASIQSGSAYSATLTADTNYAISSVTVTMGGVDVTSTVYDSSDNSITIASVTGDIVITASATVVVTTIAFTLGSIDTSGAETVSTTRARSASIPVTLATPTLNSTVKAQIAGVVSASGLINNNATNRITTERLPVIGGSSFSASCASGYYLKAFVYSDTAILSNNAIGSFSTNTISGTIAGTGTYLRIAFKRSDDGAITSSDFAALNLTINGVAHSVEVGDISVGLKIKVNATVNGVTAQYAPRLYRNGTYFPTNSGSCYDTDPAYYSDTNNSNRHYSVAQYAVGDNTEYVFESVAADVSSVRLLVRTANGSDNITNVAGSVFINDAEYQISFS